MPTYSIRKIPQCGKCHIALPESEARAFFRRLYKLRRPFLLTIFFAGFSLFVGSALFVSFRPPSAIAPQRHVPCRALPLPRAGVYAVAAGSRLIAEFTIRTTTGASYLINLDDPTTGLSAVSYFVHGGYELEDFAPLGTFRLKYAAGQSWCGDQELFGDDTSYNEAESLLTFDELPGYYPTHLTVELIRQPNGNLETVSITRSEFEGKR